MKVFTVRKLGKKCYGVAARGWPAEATPMTKPLHLGMLNGITGSDADAAKREAQALCDLLNQAWEAFRHGVRAADLVQRPAEQPTGVDSY